MIIQKFLFRHLITLLSLNIIVFTYLIQPANAKYINETDYIFTTIVADISEPIYSQHFTYTGYRQIFKAPYNGHYAIQLWGAYDISINSYYNWQYNCNEISAGANEYIVSEIYLNKGEYLYISIGKTNTTNTHTNTNFNNNNNKDNYIGYEEYFTTATRSDSLNLSPPHIQVDNTEFTLVQNSSSLPLPVKPLSNIHTDNLPSPNTFLFSENTNQNNNIYNPYYGYAIITYIDP